MIRHVIWDFNGTLLDDVDHALEALNTLLLERGMPQLDRAAYRESFGFPVRDFYVGLGFELATEDFAALSDSFIAHYKRAARSAQPHAGVRETMLALSELGVEQSVLSAMELTLLDTMLREHGLFAALRHVRGLDHLQATSKVSLGVELMRTLQASNTLPEQCLFIGDTLHDLETATAMGCQCLLYVHGHQTPQRLAQGAGQRAQLIHSFSEVLGFVRAHG